MTPFTPDEASLVKEGAVTISFLSPLANLETVKKLASRKATTFAMELIPRISRAQPMDALSSQANVAGYKAVLLAADTVPKLFPLMMTAAGTISPAKVFILGAGVAGLQAIATAKRLGAVVEAYDVRPVVKEQVMSLGAKFAEMPVEAKDAQDAGGYAKAMGEEFTRKQQEFLAGRAKLMDVVITTALIPNQRAPDPNHRGRREGDAPGLSRRRPRGGGKGQLRRHRAGQDRREIRSHHSRPAEPALHDGARVEQALLQEHLSLCC